MEKAMNKSTGRRNKLSDKITPRILIEVRDAFREGGFKGVIRRFGWKMFAAFFVYYLVRDVTLYILLPWYLANKLM